MAKKALEGEDIVIINCEKAVVSGTKKNLLAKYKRMRSMGIHTKGPFWPRMPDRFVKRTIRGMVPYKQPKGRAAFRKIKCYIGVPEEFKDKKADTIQKANSSKM